MIKQLSIILLSLLLTIFNTNFLYAEIKNVSIEKMIDDMSIEDKIGQMFIIRLEMLDPEYKSDKQSGKTIIHTSITDKMKQFYNEYPAGGIILFSRNIENEEQLKNLTQQIHDLSELTPFVSIDEEGGSVSRIANNSNFDVPRFTSNEAIANTNNIEKAYDLGYSIGSYLSKFGIDLDFAPVADINTNSNNKIIGKRAFGSDPYLAGEMIAMCIAGFRDTNILTCIKHFPGHGDTSSDSHLGSVFTYKTWDEMLNEEIIPFKYGISSNTNMIMIGHISAPNVTGNNEPATLSYELLTNKLRDELGYEGIIITDSFEMGAITNNYTVKDAVIKAVNAGVDIILMPENYIEAFNAFKEAIDNKEISIERVNESLKRILTLKDERFSLLNIDNNNVDSNNMLMFPNKKLLELLKTHK